MKIAENLKAMGISAGQHGLAIGVGFGARALTKLITKNDVASNIVGGVAYAATALGTAPIAKNLTKKIIAGKVVFINEEGIECDENGNPITVDGDCCCDECCCCEECASDEDTNEVTEEETVILEDDTEGTEEN